MIEGFPEVEDHRAIAAGIGLDGSSQRTNVETERLFHTSSDLLLSECSLRIGNVRQGFNAPTGTTHLLLLCAVSFFFHLLSHHPTDTELLLLSQVDSATQTLFILHYSNYMDILD